MKRSDIFNTVQAYEDISWLWLTYPSEKYESQLGWWNSQYMEKNVPNHQPVSYSHLSLLSLLRWQCQHMPIYANANRIWMKWMNLESNIKSHASDLAMVQRTTSSNIIQNKIPTPPTPTAFLDFFSQCPTSNDSVGRGREDGTSGSSGVPKEVFSSCCRAMSLRLLELLSLQLPQVL